MHVLPGLWGEIVSETDWKRLTHYYIQGGLGPRYQGIERSYVKPALIVAIADLGKHETLHQVIRKS